MAKLEKYHQVALIHTDPNVVRRLFDLITHRHWLELEDHLDDFKVWVREQECNLVDGTTKCTRTYDFVRNKRRS